MKKYVEKRWVASSETPSIPPGKAYRPQESRVIEFISSGLLDRIRQTTHTNVGNPPVSEQVPLQLLRKSQRDTKSHKANHCNTTRKTAAVDRDREDFLEHEYHPVNVTMASPSTFEPQNLVASSSSSITMPVGSDSITETFYSTTSEHEKEMTIDDYLPESFKYALMTPSALSVDYMSSFSRTDSMQSQENSSSLDREDVMKIVCDVGIQTDWVILDDAEY